MTDINTLALVGRLTGDAEIKRTGSDSAFLVFSIAVNRRVKKGEEWADEASFFDVQYFSKGAERMAEWLTKGKTIALRGELRQHRWEQDGQNRQRVLVVAQDVELLGGPKGSEDTPKGGPAFDGIPF